MYGGNPTGQVMNLDIDESRIFHHQLKSITIGDFKNGIRQILVGAALGNQSAQPGQNTQEVEMVD